MRKLLNFFFLLNLIFISCSNYSTSNNSINNSNIKSIFNKPINLVFIWTTWCGISKSIIKDTYTILQKDTSKYNIILLCGNNDPQGINKYFTSQNIYLNNYIINNSSNSLPYLDRNNIRNFVQSSFTNTENIKLEGNFGIPKTFLVDSSLKVLISEMPQDTTNIRNEISKFL